jgi:hypothetical protein
MRAPAWRWIVGMAMALALACTGGALVACGGQGAKFQNIKGGEMPQGQSWLGVYYSQVYGYLHMIEQDGNIVGRWKRTDSSHWGELSGTVDGNVMHYTWKEHDYGAVGPSGDTKGSGYFVYLMGQNNIPELKGKYSVDESDTSAEWNVVKQVNMKPDINSITGDNPTDTTGRDTWH